MKLEHHPTHDFMDASKTTRFQECPRAFFFEYILGSRKKGSSTHIDYGSAIHKGMEVLCKDGYSVKNAGRAYVAFRDELTSLLTPFELSELPPNKTLEKAKECFLGYIKTYPSDKLETLHVEVPFEVMIADSMSMRGKIDWIVRDDKGKVWAVDHKTAGSLSVSWKNQFTLATQTFLYLHALYCHYDFEEVGGFIINGLIFNKLKMQFHRVYIRKFKADMEAWLLIQRRWLESVKVEIKLAFEESENNSKCMTAFPRNPTNCTKYFGCPYASTCLTIPSPLDLDRMPGDFKQEFWDPHEKYKNNKVWIGG